MVGFEPQISYANLVEKLCGKVLKKSQTRANWEKRPLSKEMINYAREDVEFLLEMHTILLEKLKKMDRISWAEEDSKSLNNCNLYKFDPNEAINRIKSAKYLSVKTKKAIHLLLKWREKKAIEKNLPRQWILRDKTLVNIASTSIEFNGDFSNIKNISDRFIKKNGDEIIKILEKSIEGMLLKIDQTELWTNLSGKFNAYNLLSVISAATLLGIPKNKALEYASLLKSVRGRFEYVTDEDALKACFEVSRLEGIIPALETAHAFAVLKNIELNKEDVVVINLSGRGDKDLSTLIKYM